MAGPRRVRDQDVRLLRQSAQLLHRPAKSSEAKVVRHLIGAPAQDLPAVGLALRARSARVTAEGVRRARVRDRSVVRTWAMRGTLHVIAAEDHAWLIPVTAESSFPGAARRLRQLGVTGDQPDRAVRALVRSLGRHGPATRSDLGQVLRRVGIPALGQGLIHLIRLAALRGLVCYGPDEDGEPTFVLVRDWISPGKPPDREEGLSRLAARYLAAYGPATPEDFAAWSGLRAAEVRRGWRSIADRLIEIGTRSGPMWALRSPDPDPPAGVTRLIPGFDPYLLGWQRRDFAVPARFERRVFPGGGMLRPTLLVDGMAAGTWSAKRHERMVVTVSPFARLKPVTRRSLAKEAADLGRFHTCAAELAMA